jgi:hypothetical protein
MHSLLMIFSWVSYHTLSQINYMQHQNIRVMLNRAAEVLRQENPARAIVRHSTAIATVALIPGGATVGKVTWIPKV